MKKPIEEEMVLNPVCSEAVFRFFTTDPKEIQQILQAIKDEVVAHYPDDDEWLEPEKKIPLLKEAEMYDTLWNGEKTYSGEVYGRYENKINKNWKDRDSGKITQDVALRRFGILQEQMCKEIYPNSMLRACAGMGDNEAVVTVERDKNAFRLNIGNNDISDNRTGWIEKIEAMGLKVEEAERCKELYEYARDCCCGIVFFGEDAKSQRAHMKELLNR